MNNNNNNNNSFIEKIKSWIKNYLDTRYKDPSYQKQSTWNKFLCHLHTSYIKWASDRRACMKAKKKWVFDNIWLKLRRIYLDTVIKIKRWWHSFQRWLIAVIVFFVRGVMRFVRFVKHTWLKIVNGFNFTIFTYMRIASFLFAVSGTLYFWVGLFSGVYTNEGILYVVYNDPDLFPILPFSFFGVENYLPEAYKGFDSYFWAQFEHMCSIKRILIYIAKENGEYRMSRSYWDRYVLDEDEYFDDEWDFNY